MLTIKCAKCGEVIYKYLKIGKGRVWHCWYNRIFEDFTVRNDKSIYCKCGNLIGIDAGKYINLKQHAFSI